jgi:F-type H+-transporting ATPase subunit epsilon
MPIRCEIVSQDRMVYQGDADIVVLPGAAGEMGVLQHHAPLLTVIQFGVVKVRTGGEEQYFTIAGGVAEILPEKVTVLADAAENVGDIDVQRAEEARRRAEEILAQGVEEDPDTYLQIQAAIKRSNLRIDAARRYKQRKP